MPPDNSAAKVWSAPGRYSHSGSTVIEDATTFRSKEQVLYDLSKALPFSPESLQANRAGKISKEQKKELSGRCFPRGPDVRSRCGTFHYLDLDHRRTPTAFAHGCIPGSV